MKDTRIGPAAFTVLVCALALAGSGVRAEQLPIRSFTTADGLPDDETYRVAADSSGFLWILTRNGLSRFDGHFFSNFGPEHGLPAGTVHDLLETSGGEILVAAGDGVYLLNPTATASGSLFEKVGAESVDPFMATVLTEDRSGVVWCGAYGGLYRMDREGESWSIRKREMELVGLVKDEPVTTKSFPPLVTAIVEDRAGSLWVGVRDIGGLVRITPDGAVRQYTTQDGLPNNDLRCLLEDSRGRLWAGTSQALFLVDTDAEPGSPLVSRVFTETDGLPGTWIADLLEDSAGRLWVGTNGGLSVLLAEAPAGTPAFRSYTTANGLSDSWINGLAEDRTGNIWIGTASSGVMKLSKSGFTNFGSEDGLGSDVRVYSIFEDSTGAVCTVTGLGSMFVNCFDGRRFVAARPNVPARIKARSWGWNQVSFQDSAGEWWVPTFEGVVRFPAVDRLEDLARVKPSHVYTKADGLASDQIFRLYEDSAGDVWIGSTWELVEDGNTLHRWVRQSDTIDPYDDLTGYPLDTVTAFAEGPDGDLWIGLYSSGFGRLRGRTFRHYTEADGVPAGFVNQFHFDRKGRLWIAMASRGLIRIDEPTAEPVEIVRYTNQDGLANEHVRCLTEDRLGRIWVGTWRSGIRRLDPESGHVRTYSRHDGLPSHQVNSCFSESDGALWFGTSHGVSRLVAGNEPDPEAPRVWIRSIRIAGGASKVYEMGAGEVSGILLDPNQRDLRIEYSALSFRPGEEVRFRYRLGGASSAWSDPGPDREVNFANLAPGRYRFEVQALTSEELFSSEPATVSFRVVPPFWQRWWFVGLMVAIVAAVAYAFHRVRLRRVVELERVRTRIATDLHDDIGSSLSQVSILSEVVRQQVGGEDPKSAEPLLEQIAGTARELVDSMSDIVWAVNPKRDRAADLVQRMRRFASDTFSGRGIRFRFEATGSGQDRRLDVETRRQVYLVFKEAVHNAVRHSRCEEARIEFGLDRNGLRLEVADDGRGFDLSGSSEGHGLDSMRERAESIGGTLTVESEPGKGTTVLLRVSL